MRDPSIAEINAEIRKIKHIMKGNIDTRNGLKFLVRDCKFILDNSKFILDIEQTIEIQKEIIKCLQRIKEKLI